MKVAHASTLLIAVLIPTFLAGCGAVPKTGPDAPRSSPPEQVVEQTAPGGMEGDQGMALDRPGGYATSLEEPGRQGRDIGLDEDADIVEPEHRVFFDFDSALIGDETAEVLARNARWLRTRDGEILIEGHCDERGTREYNLALGQKRADAVRDFLIMQGVDASRIRTISYGKERPLVKGHDEFAWSRNRRAEIALQ